MIGENPIKTNKAKAEDQIIIYYATNAAAAVALVSLPTRRAIVGAASSSIYSWSIKPLFLLHLGLRFEW